MFLTSQENSSKLITALDENYHSKIERQKLLRALKLAGVKPGEYVMKSKREQNLLDILSKSHITFEVRAELIVKRCLKSK